MKADLDSYKRIIQRRRAGYERKKAAATQEKGLLIVHTGNGKGKSTAALGIAVRVLGHGMKLGVVQFIKGALYTSERNFLGAFENCDFITMGNGYTWNTEDRNADIVSSRCCWNEASRMIKGGNYHAVILDELNIVLKYAYLPINEVLTTLTERPKGLHVIVTGRHAPSELIDAADLVTEMRLIKHPYRQHVKAQPGMEF